jgi:hypothetical protein
VNSIHVRTLDMPLTVAVVKSVPQFWFLFYLLFRTGLPLFPICWYAMRYIKSLQPYYQVTSQFYSG